MCSDWIIALKDTDCALNWATYDQVLNMFSHCQYKERDLDFSHKATCTLGFELGIKIGLIIWDINCTTVAIALVTE